MESAAHSPLNLKRKSEYISNPDEVKRTKLQPTIKTEPQFETKEFEPTNNNNKTDEELIACDDGAEESFESDSEMLESKPDDVKEELDTSLEASSARCGGEARDEMFTNYQPWVLQTYGDLTKTKTITVKKYDRIVRTLKGLIPNVAENSKFRFWVRTKGFRLGPNGEDLFVASAKGNGEEIYKRVAVVEKFFDIIYSVHVDLEGRGGRHAGQKRTYKAITESFAFLPREAVTKYLLGCVDCQKRSDVEVPSLDLKTKHPFTPTQYDKANKQNPTLFELTKNKNNSDDKCNTLKLNSPKTKDETDNLTGGIYQENYELNEGHSFSERPCTESECLLRNNNSVLYDDRQKYTESISRTEHFNDTPKTSHVPINLTVRNCRLPLNVPKVDTVFNLRKLQFKKINLLNTLGEIEQTKKQKHTEDNSRVCTSTPEHFRNKSSSTSDSTISKSSDYSSNTDISPIENEFQTFPKPYPKRLFTIHPTTFETIPIPLQQTDYGIYYEKTKPFLHPKIRKHDDKESDLLMESRPIMSAYLKHMRSLGYSDEDSLKIEAERLEDHLFSSKGEGDRFPFPHGAYPIGISDYLKQEIRTTPEPEGSDEHFQGRNGEMSPGEEVAGIWQYHNNLNKKSTPPTPRELSSPATLQETGSVHDETSSSGNKEDDDDDEEEIDDLKAVPHDPERLKAFNMFVRLFVDENLDRIVPISKQPKEKIQAIIDSCTRQFPEFAERARKRIRTYLKSCRRNKRTRDSGWPESTRPTPAHLTSVQAEQILAQACENESHNAKRMRLGLEPVSQPMPVIPGSEPITTRPVAHDVFSPALVGSTNINMDTKQQHLIHLNNNNKPESPNLAKVSEPSNHLMNSSPLNGAATSTAPTTVYRPNFSQAFQRSNLSQSPFPGAPMFPTPFGAPSMMPNGPTDLSMKPNKPLLTHKLNPTEIAAVRQLITGYRESAAFLLRSAEELEQLLLQQP